MKFATLNNRAMVRVEGDDAAHFLENLVTCKVETLGKSETAFGALLTPQGKILYDFFLQATAEGYTLDIDRAIAEEFAKRLGFYKLRAKVTITGPENLPVYACWDCDRPDGSRVMQDPRHPEMGFRVAGGENPDGCEADYIAHRIALGIPEGGKDFEYGNAYPHETLMDQFGGVDFRKGCYVGQEVVSRMQHRGTTKKRIVHVEGDASLPGDAPEITADGKPAGRLGSVCEKQGLALLRLDRATQAGALLAGDAPVRIRLQDWVKFELPGAAA